MFMRKAPAEIDPKQNPDLACLQSIIFDEDQTSEGSLHLHTVNVSADEVYIVLATLSLGIKGHNCFISISSMS